MKSVIIFINVILLQACINTYSGTDEVAAQYNTYLGLAYLSQGNSPLAKIKLLQALRQNSNDPNVNYGLASYFEHTKDNTLAEKYYRKAIRLSVKRGAYLNNYACFLCRQRRFREASRYFMLAVNDVNYAETAKTFTNAGFCSLAAGNNKEAKQYFQQAVHKDSRLIKFLQEIDVVANNDINCQHSLE